MSTNKDKLQVSDEAVKAKTGRDWNEWFAVLDQAGAQELSHKEIVAILANEYGVGPWWQQMVTVGYEQARGLRDKHETSSGYQISRSKTLADSPEQIFAAWNDEQLRQQWFPEGQLQIRTATPGKTLRITWLADNSNLEVYLYPKGEKTQVTLQQSRLRDAELAEKMKAFWGEVLARLEAYLKS